MSYQPSAAKLWYLVSQRKIKCGENTALYSSWSVCCPYRQSPSRASGFAEDSGRYNVLSLTAAVLCLRLSLGGKGGHGE